MRPRLLVATHNHGKVQELQELLEDLNLDLLGLDDARIEWDVEETGTTFRENAILKATTYARASDMLTLADDSGLEIDALNGQPGVFTARFGGEGLTPEQRYLLLLQKMSSVPPEARTARFRCVVALANPDGVISTTEGVIEGRIALEPIGEGGFGYDPVFYVQEQGQTMAELPADVKNRISHRARAVSAIKPRLRELAQS